MGSETCQAFHLLSHVLSPAGLPCSGVNKAEDSIKPDHREKIARKSWSLVVSFSQEISLLLPQSWKKSFYLLRWMLVLLTSGEWGRGQWSSAVAPGTHIGHWKKCGHGLDFFGWMGECPSRESLKNSLDKFCQKCFPWLTAQGKG